MKCPKCGNEIKEGHLYCDVCGEEIRIVPDFDATVDENLDISLTGVIDTAGVIEGLQKVATKEIAKEIDKEATKEIDVKKDKSITDTLDIVNINEDSSEPEANKKSPAKNFIIKALVITGAICAVLAFVGTEINKRVNEFYSVDFQYEKAFEEFENDKYEDSIKTLKRASSIDPDDSRIKLLIADNYFMMKKFDESNAVLYDLLEQYPDDPNIYEKIIANYIEKEDYEAINTFLTEVKDEPIKEKYSDYIAYNVSFSVEEGSYDEVKYLELSSNEGCTIFYTLDGSEAGKSSYIYTEPIILDAGEHVVNAIAVNKVGITSENIKKEYIIDFYEPDAPVVSIKSGTYNVPVPIELKFADFDLCYYTIDGEDPTADDLMYQGPIAMYIGTHTYKFAVISDKGISSDVVTLDISLDLITLVGMDTAKSNLINWINTTGKGGPEYSYKCEQACVYNNSTYYIINEYIAAEGGIEQTGNHYAVDVLTGMTFKASPNKSTGEFTLEALI